MAKKKVKVKEETAPAESAPIESPVVAPVDMGDRAMTPLEKAHAQAEAIIAKAEANDKEQKDLNKKFDKSNDTVYVSQFAEHLLRVKPIIIKVDNQGRTMILDRGNTIQFHNKIYSTSNPEEIKAIETSPDFGSVIQVAKSAPEQIKQEVAAQKGE